MYGNSDFCSCQRDKERLLPAGGLKISEFREDRRQLGGTSGTTTPSTQVRKHLCQPLEHDPKPEFVSSSLVLDRVVVRESSAVSRNYRLLRGLRNGRRNVQVLKKLKGVLAKDTAAAVQPDKKQSQAKLSTADIYSDLKPWPTKYLAIRVVEPTRK